jgi:acyl-CoA synthetase (AMP-forming)/AMP-acid ligase II
MNAGAYLGRAARHYPDRPGVVCSDVRLTWREANARTDAFAAALRSLGVVPGDRVGIFMTNCHEYLEVLFGCFKAGIAAIPINVRLHPAEVAFHLRDARAAALVVSAGAAEMADGLRTELPEREHQIVVGGARPGQLDYEGLLTRAGKVGDQTVEVDVDDTAWLFYTSGTTGRPKGVMLTHANLVAAAVGWSADLIPLSPEHVTLHCAPLSHGAGIHAIAAVAKAATNVILERFDPEEVCAAIERERVTNTWMVPTQIKLLVHSPAVDRHDLASLGYVVYGGAPMYLEDLQFAVRRLGKVWVQIFGQGESPMTGTYLRREAHVADGSENDVHRMLSAGIPRTDIEVRCVDDDDVEVSVGERGEICLRGPTVMKGYWERPEATAEAVRGGWLHTGDIGYLDERGYLYVVDRKKDMVISGGMNIYPREVEEVLQRHPAVFECSVFGVPDPTWGEAVRAVVVLREGHTATEADLIEHCRANLASFKKPRVVEFTAKLPKSAYGKILKRELRDEHWREQGRDI